MFVTTTGHHLHIETNSQIQDQKNIKEKSNIRESRAQKKSLAEQEAAAFAETHKCFWRTNRFILDVCHAQRMCFLT
jgi:UDP-3-O-[3-hydroxymyristoyl] glucosamine N-acyltransferase